MKHYSKRAVNHYIWPSNSMGFKSKVGKAHLYDHCMTSVNTYLFIECDLADIRNGSANSKFSFYYTWNGSLHSFLSFLL